MSRPSISELEAMYATLLRPSLGSEAAKTAKEMVEQAVQESKQEGTYDLPSDLGEMIVGDKPPSPSMRDIVSNVRSRLPLKRADGVTDNDIRWWWSLFDVDRKMLLKTDDFARTTLFLHVLEKNGHLGKEVAVAKAGVRVRKLHPIYGLPDDDDDYARRTGTGKEDRPLPYELKHRVNQYIERRARRDVEVYKEDIERSTSFNALVRK